MATKWKNNVALICTIISAAASVIGLIYIGIFLWAAKADLIDTLQLLRKLF
ncbi:hypothetical protein P9B03_08830 [Metasolibacillus meyeri]|uniref:Uncharacterized protein n=1 Tax=Metasolibacillus meyeri TaxID=1071052 RepID=A0AAW9NTD7_9BACL|nr:hypothetical protein [Metasolibacillus meyeri]MEC1178584.1 hypothetical protein [Metasolibacillus meyeri]